MGEIADDIIEGRCCSNGCGTYFIKEHGYPVLCDHCFNQAEKSGKIKRGRYVASPVKAVHQEEP